MRVALFVHCFFPNHFYGTETYTFDLARNLRAMGHEPVVVSGIFHGEPKQEKMVAHYEYAGIPVYCIDKNYLPDTRIKDSYYRPEMYNVLKDILSSIKPEIVHVTHLMNHTAVLLDVAEDLDLPIIASCTDFLGFCYNHKLEAADGTLCKGPNRGRTNCLACLLKVVAQDPPETFIRRLVGRYLLFSAHILNGLRRIPGFRKGKIARFVLDIVKRPDLLMKSYSKYRAVIVATKFLGDSYLSNGLTVPVHKIRFGVDLSRDPKRSKKKGMPIKLGFIGQIAPHKGTEILVEAFCRLPEGAAELHLYGSDDTAPEYFSRLRKRSVGRKVFFHGTFPKEKIGEVLSDMDFLCIPSIWYENSPLVLLNALASHTPVIVSDVEGMTEFVKEGENGYIFSRGDTNDLERVLRAIIGDPEKAWALTDTTEYERTTKTMTEDVLLLYYKILHH
ncbi:MAG: glycosyltransferase family 4 protein [Nitrospiraceae bacterium]|nr:glycosyltransferase family 4 protein [Nitrospiraceae bacterium]